MNTEDKPTMGEIWDKIDKDTKDTITRIVNLTKEGKSYHQGHLGLMEIEKILKLLLTVNSFSLCSYDGIINKVRIAAIRTGFLVYSNSTSTKEDREIISYTVVRNEQPRIGNEDEDQG